MASAVGALVRLLVQAMRIAAAISRGSDGIRSARPLVIDECYVKVKGGVLVVLAQINGAMTLDFMIDSGSSDVNIPADAFSTLKRTGTVDESGFVE